MKKRILSTVMAFIMVISITTIPESGFIIYAEAATRTPRTLEQALNWVRDKLGTFYDQDGVYGSQCVDLINGYYIFFGGSRAPGHARDFATNSVPQGFTRFTLANTPGGLQPGDIFVNTAGTYGHVGIVESVTNNSNFISICANWGTGPANTASQNNRPVIRVTRTNYTVHFVIRPTFSSGGGTTTTTPPSVPTGLTVARATNTTARVSWNAVSGTGISYEVEYRRDNTNIFREWRTCPDYTNRTATSYNPAGMVDGVIYSFRVRAVNSAGQRSGWSTIASYTHTSAATGLAVSSTASGRWTITIPANTTVNLFSTPTGTTRHTFYSPRTTSFNVTSFRRLTMNDGTTRFHIQAPNQQGVTEDLYFVRTSSMSVVETTYTVNFNANGGFVSPASRTVSHGATVGTLPTPTNPFNVFNGWFTDSTGGTQVSASTVITGNVTYFAQWIPNTYIVTFDANGGTVSPTSRIVSHGAAINTLPIPTLAGHTFNGWFSAATGGVQLSAATTIFSNITFFAQWTVNAAPICDVCDFDPCICNIGSVDLAYLIPVTNGNIVDFIVSERGDFDGALTLYVSEGLAVESVEGGYIEGIYDVLTLYDRESSTIVYAGLDIPEDIPLLTITFSGAGSWFLIWQDGSFIDTDLTGIIDGVCIDCGKYPCECLKGDGICLFCEKLPCECEVIDNPVTMPVVATPTASPVNLTFTSVVNVTLTTETEGAELYFTINGVNPTIESFRYTAPLMINETSTIRVIAIKEGMADSEVLTVTFTKGNENSSGGGGGGSFGGGGGGGSFTPPVDTTPTTPTVTTTTGTATWTVTNIPRAAFTSLGLSTNIPVRQLRVPTGATGNQNVNIGTTFAGQNAVLVKYNSTSGELEFVSSSTVDTSGNANINVSETGDFLVLTFKTGDVTGTGTVETSDALALLRHVAGIKEFNSIQLFVANGKVGEVGTGEALNILRYIAGLIDKI
jgi:uncharacterized repeat protein (TIGR02543 family)